MEWRDAELVEVCELILDLRVAELRRGMGSIGTGFWEPELVTRASCFLSLMMTCFLRLGSPSLATFPDVAQMRFREFRKAPSSKVGRWLFTIELAAGDGGGGEGVPKKLLSSSWGKTFLLGFS